jgi:hypothetical protein
VAAYSTLGWFNDPLISTFINYPDGELARMIFHELAHQVVYVPGDSQFNESFASDGGRGGRRAWLDRFGSQAMRDSYARYRGRKKDFLACCSSTARRSNRTTRWSTAATEKRAVKARLFTDLKERIPGPEGQLGRLCRLRPLLRAAAVERPPGLDRDLRRLRAGLPRPAAREGSFPRFYKAVKRLAELDRKRPPPHPQGDGAAGADRAADGAAQRRARPR